MKTAALKARASASSMATLENEVEALAPHDIEVDSEYPRPCHCDSAVRSGVCQRI